MEDRDRRVRNEALFRTVNEKLRGLNAAFAAVTGETAVFVCECSRLDCVQQIELPLTVFDDVAASARRFVVVPGHERPGVELVVGRENGYLVVEKTLSVA